MSRLILTHYLPTTGQPAVGLHATLAACPLLKCPGAAKKRGRPAGWRKTTRAEDKLIMSSFHKARRPLGSQVTSRDVAVGLPRDLRSKVSRRTIRNRLAARGFTPDRMVEKNVFLKQQAEARLRSHALRPRLKSGAAPPAAPCTYRSLAGLRARARHLAAGAPRRRRGGHTGAVVGTRAPRWAHGRRDGRARALCCARWRRGGRSGTVVGMQAA